MCVQKPNVRTVRDKYFFFLFWTILEVCVYYFISS
jgi:hypothetical protein